MSLIVFILIVLVIEFVSAGATMPAIRSGWYGALAKPSFNPPNWIFGPVWFILYLMIALSGWMIWKARASADIRAAMIAYSFQLILNLAWSFLFFYFKNLKVSFFEITFLWIAIAWTIYFFWLIRPEAAYLLIPYFGWVSFALCLNFSIWRLNI